MGLTASSMIADPFRVTASGESSYAPRTRIDGTDQQEDFWAELIGGNSHILLEARAGTGKSTSCREGMWRLLEDRRNLAIRYCCFNKKVADEFAVKCPPGVDVGTMHRFGLQALKSSFGSQIDAQKTYLILDMIGGENLKRYHRKAISNLVSLAKNHAIRPGDPTLVNRLLEFVVYYDVETWGQLDKVVSWAVKVLDKSAETTSIVDFDDMLWLSVLHPVRFPSVDFLFIDECLPGWTPVLLADGTSKTIGEIVDGQLPVEVLAFDTEEGVQRPCRITKWSKTLNQKPLVKIRVKWNRKKGTNRPTNFVICTTDHKIWAGGRWVPAGEIEPGMHVQVETSALKSQHGKITSKGRRVLAGAIAGRNSDGIMSHGKIRRSAPKIRGGNGTGPTLAESTLHRALGNGWTLNHIVPTGSRGEGIPTHFKIDIADIDRMIAVEVDGESHNNPERRKQDRRKEEFLRANGWKVTRVTNRMAIQQPANTASMIDHSECPIGATVISVEPVEIPDSYVYDITVDDCHNFYANGILVHNCQDLNPVQHELASRLSGSGRTIVVGDPYQAIYAFRGADSDSIPKLRDQLSAKVMPLTVTWRCPRSHVDLARQLVADFEAATEAPEGTLDAGDMSAVDKARPGDLVLCRANAPIIAACLRAIANRVPAIVRGRAIGDQLLTVYRHVPDAATIGDWLRSLDRWKAKEIARLEARDGTESLVEAVNDKAACLLAIGGSCDTPGEIPTVINSLFADDDAANRVTFSSVHRAKGSEAKRVHYIQIPYSEKRDKIRPPQPWEIQQRRNLRYVALSRSLDYLCLVTA